MRERLAGLQRIDRRLIYLLVALLVTLPLFIPFKPKLSVSPEARQLFDFIEQMPRDKLVLIAVDWDAGTRGENWPQTEAVITHLLRTKRKFAIFGFAIQGPQFAQNIADKWSKVYGGKYGKDWCNWGYQAGYDTTLRAMAQNIPAAVKTDIRGTPVSKLPMMAKVRDFQDVGLIAEFTGSGYLDMYLQRVPGTPLAQGCTAIIAPEQYTYLRSGQLKGLLVGMRGAAEYEQLLEEQDKAKRVKARAGVERVSRRARLGMNAQSMAHLLIMVLIILGNIGMAAARKRTEPREEGK
jgi:hypothetical protein